MGWVQHGPVGQTAQAYFGNVYAANTPNVVWQDTTSNATYCSASAALTNTVRP